MKRLFTKALAALAVIVLPLATGLSAAGASVPHSHMKPNATLVCGSACFDLSSTVLGDQFIQNARGGPKLGHKVFLRIATNAYPNEDFQATFTGIVGNATTPGSACFIPEGSSDGLLPHNSKLCLDGLYHFDPVFEAAAAPDSNATNSCVGVRTPTDGAKVVLRPCGVDARTLWIGDFVNATTEGDGATALPWINGADTAFSNPLVLQVALGSQFPANQLQLGRENVNAGHVNSTKTFEIQAGPVA